MPCEKMDQSLIQWSWSELVHEGELTFREEIEEYQDPRKDMEQWIKKKRVVELFEYFIEKTAIDFHGIVVELGAGSCWLSSMISKFPRVTKIYAVELSRRRLELLAPVMMDLLGAKKGKILRVVGDFNRLELADSTVDFVVMDAALHHSTDPKRTMTEVSRVLKQGGLFIAFREQTLPRWRGNKASVEQKIKADHGNFEHIYYKHEYVQIIQSVGHLKAKVIPAPHLGARSPLIAFLKRCPPLCFLNGLLFSDFIYLAKKLA